MAELFTAITDFILAALCALFARAFTRDDERWIFRGPLVLFAGFALAAFAGGIWHEFFSARQDLAQALVWWLSMSFTGVTAAGLALVGLELLGASRVRLTTILIVALLAVYAVLAWSDPRFLIALVATIVGTLLCIAGLVRRIRVPGSSLVLAGLGISIIAAFAQQRGVALYPGRFDHNATYHLLLLPALWLIYTGLRRLAAERSTPQRYQAMP
ncbi:MAG TPA: hypothetical protein VEZ88_05355 [Steroidobacteraceae bacterium]|nr:hypothetical protein [Steroidobacteraceae bacterium]